MDDDAHVLAPAYVNDSARDRIVVATNAGHLLMFSVAELPELDNGGKGNKLIEIPKAKLDAGRARRRRCRRRRRQGRSHAAMPARAS
jgi:topoisomerase-4 subunit A